MKMMSPENFSAPKVEAPSLENEDRQKLSNEKIESILEKTTDINAIGTAFSVVGSYYPDEWKDKVDKFNKEITNTPSLKDWFYDKFINDEFERRSRCWKIKQDCEWGSKKVEDFLNNPSGSYREYLLYLKEVIGVNDVSEEYECSMPIGSKEKKYVEGLIEKMGLPIDKPMEEELFLKTFFEVFSDNYLDTYTESLKEKENDLKENFYGKDFETFKDDYERKLRSSYSGYLSAQDPDDLFNRYENFRKDFNQWGKDHNLFGYHNSRWLEKLGLPDRWNTLKEPEEISKEEFIKRFNAKVKEEQDIVGAYAKYHENYDETVKKEKALSPLKSILTHGIFGGRRWRSSGPNALTGYSEGSNQANPLVQTPEAYVQDIRTKDEAEKRRKERHVFFNVVGNFHNQDIPHGQDYPRHPLHYEELAKMKMKDCYWIEDSSITVIFDKKGMEYENDDPRLSTPRSEHGYAGPARVAPRKFLGIVVSYPDPEQCQRAANDIAQVMLETDTNHPERLIPIYDISGNMLWPKNISYEEIQKEQHKDV